MSLSDEELSELASLIHKAEPSEKFEWVCTHCGLEIKKVPGGQGTTYIHVETGAVAGSGGADG